MDNLLVKQDGFELLSLFYVYLIILDGLWM